MVDLFETIGTRTMVRNFKEILLLMAIGRKFSMPVSGHQLQVGTSNGFFVLWTRRKGAKG